MLTVEEAKELIREITRTETPTSDETYKKAWAAMIDFYNAAIDYKKRLP